ncbi:MAG: TatA/E family twin arginine-targeting protein translocase [Candidatus Acididesulfobacter guangdongensis]|uniref:Sec-independent protein translocase protein TatA n=1 Tax=Acididesulfobacter guangdongensis TaxID=2597225 RepID=A0A519BIV4_ACIG2|nr:MAG: TatA/E family twin arginine-targeting protein translocase [Candidatus Acididesulfobacter guangdongensis]
MFGIGTPEIIIIIVVALLVFGPKRLPDIGKSLGKGLREFKKATSEFKDQMNNPMDDKTDGKNDIAEAHDDKQLANKKNINPLENPLSSAKIKYSRVTAKKTAKTSSVKRKQPAELKTIKPKKAASSSHSNTAEVKKRRSAGTKPTTSKKVKKDTEILQPK